MNIDYVCCGYFLIFILFTFAFFDINVHAAEKYQKEHPENIEDPVDRKP